MTNLIFSDVSRPELQQDRQGLRLAAYLNLPQTELPHGISERLRVARQQALAHRKQAVAAAPVWAGDAGLAWQGDEHLSWWARVGSVLPLIALVAGLLMINSIQNDHRAQELAEVDVALLTDELPVAAFADPGFLQFLKTEP